MKRCTIALILIALAFLCCIRVGEAAPALPFGVFNDLELRKSCGVSLESAREMGVQRTRLVVHWALVEPKKGKWNFTFTDRMVDMHHQARIDMLLTLHAVSPWATMKAGGRMTFLASPPKNMADYERFVRTLVQRYRGRVSCRQIENEVFDRGYGPSLFWDGSKEEYVDLHRHACLVIREEDPGAKVVMAGFAHEIFVLLNGDYPFYLKVDTNKVRVFFEHLVEKGGPYCDAFNFHQYYEFDSQVRELGLLKSTMKKFGIRRDIISMEAADFDLRCFPG